MCFKLYSKNNQNHILANSFQQGFRDFWPYLIELSDRALIARAGRRHKYYYNEALSTAKEISKNETLRARLYCYLDFFPLAGKESLQCIRFVDPMDMLRQNIPLSVINAMLAFCSFLFGILGKYNTLS